MRGELKIEKKKKHYYLLLYIEFINIYSAIITISNISSKEKIKTYANETNCPVSVSKYYFIKYHAITYNNNTYLWILLKLDSIGF